MSPDSSAPRGGPAPEVRAEEEADRRACVELLVMVTVTSLVGAVRPGLAAVVAAVAEIVAGGRFCRALRFA